MIREIMTSGDALEVVAENLIRAANNNGGTDNITVVLVQTFVDPLWVPPSAYTQEARY
jgi:serine/threonine protein phosphatase PrpC